MRYLFFAVIFCIVFSSCGKDKFTSAPQITFKSITSPYFSNSPQGVNPILVIELTDAEGDFGFTEGKDTSYVYVKNITVPPFKIDSFKFPASLSKAVKKNFKADLEIDLVGDININGSGVLTPSTRPRPKTDTLYFEVYVKDFAKNKSNVIKTADPLFLIVR